MSPAFTEYVRALEPGVEPPPGERFDAFWGLLRRALVHEMKKRGLWQASPRYLGVYGRTRWSHGDALEELLVDCYAFVVSRLRGLKAALERKADIEDLLFLNVRNFLHDTQRRHDPLGFRVFTMLRSAIRGAIHEGSLHVIAGDPRIRKGTVLCFAPGSEPVELAGSASLVEPVRAWSDDLLPDLIVGVGRGLSQVRRKLEGHVLALRRQGLAFRFEDVIDPFKSDVRSRWAAIWLQSEGEAVEENEAGLRTLVRKVDPDLESEERDSYRHLVDCVNGALERLAAPEKTRARLHRLFRYVTTRVAEDAEERRLPSQRTLADLLALPRARLPDLLATLGGLVEACHSAGSRKAPVKQRAETNLPAAGREAEER